MMINCPVCGKPTVVHWPEHWVYRRGETFYCSDQCMDVDSVRDMKMLNMVLMRRRINPKQVKETDMKNHKLTLEQKKRAMEMEQEGKDPIPFLKECGAKNPYAAMDYIRKTVGKKEVPEKAPVVYPVAAETVETPEGGWIPAKEVYREEKKPEQAEAEQTEEDGSDLVNCEGFSIQQVNGQKSGIKYEYKEERNELAVTFNGNISTIVMTPLEWEKFSHEVVRAMVLMGV